MGYFDRLQKKARYYDADAGEYRWSSWKYTGSAAAGVDYVNDGGLWVLYGANVFYDSEETGLRDLWVATNFVNPLSSGNPSEARCYLYLTDPSAIAGADFSSPPPGCWAIAAPQSFEADTAGDYLSFSFTALNRKPGQVYFLFACSAENQSQGSNQIYHYATGNYSAALGTGTRSPAIGGSFTGGISDGAGGEGYTLIDSGSRSGIFARQDISLNRAERSASRLTLSFAGGGSVAFYLQGGSGDSLLDLSYYLSDSPGFDTARGLPTGNVLAQKRNNGQSCYMNAQVSAGTAYYLFAVVERAGYTENSISIGISPESWSYTVIDRGAAQGLDQSEKSFTLSMGAFQVGRMALSFDYHSQIELRAQSGTAGSFIHLWLSEQSGIQSSSGWPKSYLLYLGDGGSGYYTVERGKTYYLFALFKGGSEAGSVSVTLTPPPVLWYLGGGGQIADIAAEQSMGLALSSGRYARYELSFAHTGTARIWTENSAVPEGQRMEAFFCLQDSFDASQGYPMSHIEHAYGQSWGETADLGFYAEVVAGKRYWLYVKNTLRAEGLDTSISCTLHLQAPEAHSGGYYLHSIDDTPKIYADTVLDSYVSRWTVCRRHISFNYRGEAGFAVALAQDSMGRSGVRTYLSESAEVDLEKGLPAGEYLSFAAGAEGFELEAEVEENREYYVFLVCDEIYGDTLALFELAVKSPEGRYFSVTDSEALYCLSGAYSRSSSPGTGGVCLLELSFDKAGRVSLACEEEYGEVCLFVSDTAYLDPVSGCPCGNILAQGGSGESLDFAVGAKSSVYVFARASSVYEEACFTLQLVNRGGAAYLKCGEKARSALVWIFTGERWTRALPCCRSGGEWKRGG